MCMRLAVFYLIQVQCVSVKYFFLRFEFTCMYLLKNFMSGHISIQGLQLSDCGAVMAKLPPCCEFVAPAFFLDKCFATTKKCFFTITLTK